MSALNLAFKKREKLSKDIRNAPANQNTNALFKQWSAANGELQKALLNYIPDAVHNGTNIKNNTALNGIINRLAQNNKYTKFVGPLITRFKGLKTRYQNSSATTPNYSGSLSSILQVLTNNGVNVSAAREVVNSNANMSTKFEAVSQALTAALAAKKTANVAKNSLLAAARANIEAKRLASANKNKQIEAKNKEIRGKNRFILRLQNSIRTAKAEASVARAEAARASVAAQQHRNSAELAEGRARGANAAVKEAQNRAKAANAKATAAVEAKIAAEAAARNASAANKTRLEREAAAAQAAATAALKEARNAHAANKAAAAAALNEEKRARAANKAAANVAAAAAQKLHAAEATKARAVALAAVARSISAQRKANRVTEAAAKNLANRNAQVAAAKAQVEAEAAKVTAAVEAKTAAETAARAARNANAENRAGLMRAAATAAQIANRARQEANAAREEHAREKAKLEARATAANASVAEKEAAIAALNAEKKALQTEKNRLENLNRAKVSLPKVNQASQVGASSTAINKLPTGLPRAQSLTTEANRQNWNKFTRNAGKYMRQTGQWKSGQFNKKIARGIKNNRNNPIAQEVLNAEWNVHKANNPNKIKAARARYTEAQKAWETSKNNITKQQGFYNAYKTFKYIKNYAKDTSLNTVIKRAAGAAIGNSQFETNSKKTVTNGVINSIKNTNIRNRLKEMIKIRDYKKFLSNNTIKKRANLKQQYNDAVKYLSNKNFNFSTFETKMRVLQNAARAPVPAPSRPAPPPPAAAYTKTNNRIYHVTAPTNFAGIGSVWTKNGYGFIKEPLTNKYRPIMSRVATNVIYHPNKQNKTKEVKVKAYLIGNANAKLTNTWNNLKLNSTPLPAPAPANIRLGPNRQRANPKLKTYLLENLTGAGKRGQRREVLWYNSKNSSKRPLGVTNLYNKGNQYGYYAWVKGKFRPLKATTKNTLRNTLTASINMNNKKAFGQKGSKSIRPF
jgi:hypothetical protein